MQNKKIPINSSTYFLDLVKFPTLFSLHLQDLTPVQLTQMYIVPTATHVISNLCHMPVVLKACHRNAFNMCYLILIQTISFHKLLHKILMHDLTVFIFIIPILYILQTCGYPIHSISMAESHPLWFVWQSCNKYFNL